MYPLLKFTSCHLKYSKETFFIYLILNKTFEDKYNKPVMGIVIYNNFTF